ncbi:MAG: hypothetical protein RR777_03580, partial [Christensenellaceae bacterium]
MGLEIAPLFSGSKGNCIYIGTQTSKVLIDAGFSCTKIAQELQKVEIDLLIGPPISAAIITPISKPNSKPEVFPKL